MVHMGQETQATEHGDGHHQVYRSLSKELSYGMPNISNDYGVLNSAV